MFPLVDNCVSDLRKRQLLNFFCTMEGQGTPRNALPIVIDKALTQFFRLTRERDIRLEMLFI